MQDMSLTAQIQVILRHDGPMDVFVVGLAAWHSQATATEFHFLLNNLSDLASRMGCLHCKLPSHDLVIASERQADAVRSGIDALQEAFLLAHDTLDGFSLPIECFRMPDDFESLRQRLRRAAVSQLRDQALEGKSTQQSIISPSQTVALPGLSPPSSLPRDLRLPTISTAKITGPLTVQNLASIAERLDNINFSNFISRQTCFEFSDKFQPLYVEHFSNLKQLKAKLFPRVTYDEDEPLFAELCRHLDRLMLITNLIERPARKDQIGINLTAGIGQTREFQQFEKGLSAVERSNMVIEIHWLDALRDVSTQTGFLAKLALRGFRIALDRVSLDMLPLILAADIPYDFVKIAFDHKQIARLSDKAFVKSVLALPPEKLILTRCDDQLAFEVGKALGITRYQGFLVSKLAKNGTSTLPGQREAWNKKISKRRATGTIPPSKRPKETKKQTAKDEAHRKIPMPQT